MTTLGEFQKARTELKSKIMTAVSSAIGDFYEKTGRSPKEIHLSLVDVTTFTDTNPRFVLGDVRIEVEI